MKWKFVVLLIAALLLLAAGPARAQTPSIIGTWRATGDAIDYVRGIHLTAIATVQFSPDNTFTSSLSTDDGSGDPGNMAVFHGVYRLTTDPWGEPQLCVKASDANTAKCQPYSFLGPLLVWNDIQFQPYRDPNVHGS